MAYLRKDQRTKCWYVCFRWNGAQHNKSCKTCSEIEALAIRTRVTDTIQLLRTGRIEMPDGIDPAGWILAGGRVVSAEARNRNGSTRPADLRLGKVCTDYLADQNRKAESTLDSERVHIRHLKKHFGVGRKLPSIELEDLKLYLSNRLSTRHRGKPILGSTVKKELTTFRQIWVWAQRNRNIEHPCPLVGPTGRWEVQVPKPIEKIKFQTWRQIERRISRGGQLPEEMKNLWRSLFLDFEQIKELLKYVELHAAHPFIYPMFAFAAYSGARRSEICRSEIDDIDFEENLILIRERKRRKHLSGTTRFVPLHPQLRGVMEQWIEQHPGGCRTFVLPLKMRGQVVRSENPPLTPGRATKHFKTALKKSKWKVVSGFHVLRHSFGSNLARTGKVSSEEIGRWMGHTTDEMRELYQHLFPQDGLSKISVLQ